MLLISCAVDNGVSGLERLRSEAFLLRLASMDFRASRGRVKEKKNSTTVSPLFSKSTKTGRLCRPAQGRSFGTLDGFDALTASTVAKMEE